MKNPQREINEEYAAAPNNDDSHCRCCFIQTNGHSMLLIVKNVDNDIPEWVNDRLELMFQDAKVSCRRDRLPKRAIKSSVGEKKKRKKRVFTEEYQPEYNE